MESRLRIARFETALSTLLKVTQVRVPIEGSNFGKLMVELKVAVGGKV